MTTNSTKEMLDTAYRALADAYEKGQRSRDAEVERLTRELAEAKAAAVTDVMACVFCADPAGVDELCERHREICARSNQEDITAALARGGK